MSLQQITLETKGSEGIKKEINKNSIDIVFDILQVYAYSMPIESTVRELTSNAVDSQREKEIAIEILTGKKKEEDYFIVKHGKEFEDSKFKKEYYDLNWLDLTAKDVELEYHEKPGSGFCDEFVVRDRGVGIGDGRIEGVLQLGYSTKRATKEQIGGFGLGQKSPLSTMTPFYTMISAYNGQLYKLNIYSKKIDDLIGPFNLETGEANQFITLSNGAKLYYEATKSKNYTEIIVPVKKLNKHKFIEAVKTQLLYLPNVKFHVIEESGYKQEVRFKADVLYNSENLIISNNSRYSRPHLVVVKDKTSNVGICYNEINYKELELEQRYGQVGLKVQMRAVGKDENGEEYLIHEGVTVTPNREQVIWNDDTKNYLLSITKNVASEAAEIINKELIEEDFLKWIQKASEALNNIGYGTLGELSKMIDKSNIVPTYSLDKSIKFKNPGDIFWGMYPRRVSYENVWIRSTNSYIKKVNRTVAEMWSSIAGNKVYLKLDEGPASNVKDQYILQTQQTDGEFILLELNDLDAKLEDLLKSTTKETKDDVEDKFNKKREKMMKILDYMKKSKMFFSYDDLVVPDDFKVQAEEAEEKVAVIEAKETATLEELRKANGEIVFFTARIKNQYDYSSGLIWDKIEDKISTITSWTDCKVFYGFQEDAEMLQCTCRILGRDRGAWYNNKIKIVKIAQKNEKHFKAIGEHISNFWYQLENNVITMNEEVKQYFTARMVCKNVTENAKLNFFSGYKVMDKRLYDIYQYLTKYSERFSGTMKLRNDSSNPAEKQLFDQLIKYAEFQIFVEENADDEKAIAEQSKALFGTNLVKNAQILDPIIVKQVHLLEDYAEPVQELFNNVTTLNHRENSHYSVGTDISSGAESLLRIILQDIGLDKFEIPEELEVSDKKVDEKVDKDE